MKNVYWKRLVVLLILGIFTSGSGEAAQDTPFAPLKITAAVPRNFPPQYTLDSSGNPSGFAIDIMNQIAKIANLRVTYIVKDDWTEVVESLKSGEIDLIPNQGITEKRKEWSAFTSPVETFSVSIFVRETTHHIEEEADLSSHQVAVVKLNVAVTLLEDREDIQLHIFDHAQDALFELLSGHVDALVYPEPVLLKLARQIRVENQIKAVGQPMIEIKRAIAVRKDNTELLERLEQAVKGFVSSAEYKTIYLKWYGTPTPFWTVKRVILAMSGVMVTILAGMAAWRYQSVMKLNRYLKENEKELHKHREKLEILVKERTKALQETVEKFKRSNEELKQFAYVASHDLQEPLRAIIGFSEFLREDYGGKMGKEADEFIGFIVDGAQRMRMLINDLLSYSRLNSRAKPFEWVDSKEAVAIVKLNLDILIKETGAIITCEENMLRVFVDQDQFLQLLQNLISNSIRYHQENQAPIIHISATEGATEWGFSVQDNGIGIKSEFYDQIFQMFQRLHTREECSGTGIGLAICKKIVERHGGRIWVDSEKGTGSTFYFTISKRVKEENHEYSKTSEVG